jgi:hypothetical protein
VKFVIAAAMLALLAVPASATKSGGGPEVPSAAVASPATAPVAASPVSSTPAAAAPLSAVPGSKPELTADLTPIQLFTLAPALITASAINLSALNSATITTAAPVTAGAFTPATNAFVVLKNPPPPHKFLDTRNSLGLTAMASSLIADALSTQKALAYPGFSEMNPLARPFVQTRSGAALYSAGSLAALTGAMFAAHKTNHHKIERIFPFAVAGWEAALSARNYHMIAGHK